MIALLAALCGFLVGLIIGVVWTFRAVIAYLDPEGPAPTFEQVVNDQLHKVGKN